MKFLPIIFLAVICSYCTQAVKNETVREEIPKEQKKPISKIEYTPNEELIEEFFIFEDHDTIANPFKSVETHQLDLNGDGESDEIELFVIEDWGDPGSFQKVEINVVGKEVRTYMNFGGWVTFNENYTVSDEILEKNLLNSKNVLLLEVSPGNKMLFMFGHVYASDPGLMTVFEPKQNRILFSRNWELEAIVDGENNLLKLHGTSQFGQPKEVIDFGVGQISLTSAK